MSDRIEKINLGDNSIPIYDTQAVHKDESIYLPKYGGYFLKDSADNTFAGIRSNDSGLWIGRTSGTSTDFSHLGSTYIDAGWANSTTPNDTAYIVVSNYDNINGISKQNYPILHSNNWKNYAYSDGNEKQALMGIDSTKNTSFPLITYNGTHLWVGREKSTGNIFTGKTILSTGYTSSDKTTVYPSVTISRPRSSGYDEGIILHSKYNVQTFTDLNDIFDSTPKITITSCKISVWGPFAQLYMKFHFTKEELKWVRNGNFSDTTLFTLKENFRPSTTIYTFFDVQAGCLRGYINSSGEGILAASNIISDQIGEFLDITANRYIGVCYLRNMRWENIDTPLNYTR